MTFDTAEAYALEAWFSTDMGAITASLNGSDVTVPRPVYGQAEEGNAVYDYADIRFRLTDYAEADIVYRTDTVVIGSDTWRYPKFQKKTSSTMVVRWRKSERPGGWK